jgi:thiol-disulfide isomerase/thioredoxin
MKGLLSICKLGRLLLLTPERALGTVSIRKAILAASFQQMQSGGRFPMRIQAIATTAIPAAMIAAFASWHAIVSPLAQEAAVPASTTPTEPEKASFAALKTPRPLAPLGFVDGDGAAMMLSDFRGRIVLLNVWATWCVPCRKEMPALDRLQARLGGSDFTVVPLSIDHRGRDAVVRFYREYGLSSLGIYVDKSAGATYAINALGLPVTLLIDREGLELGRVIGAAEWDGDEMLSLIAGYLEARDRDHRAGKN